MQERKKVKGRCEKREFHEEIMAVPPKTNQIQNRASKSRQINPGRDEGLSVWKVRQRKERS